MAPSSRKDEAMAYKEKGNARYAAKDYKSAIEFYSQAIRCDQLNYLLYTNRAAANLKLDKPKYQQVEIDCSTSIEIEKKNLKAHYFLAMALVELKHPEWQERSHTSAKEAHRLCVEECQMVPMGKGASNIQVLTELVLKCKKEWWEKQERERLKKIGGLHAELAAILRARKDNVKCESEASEYQTKIDELASVFEMAGIGGKDARIKKVPDWAIDDITFSVMLDPVMTKNGKSYERASILNHLKNSETDPLTREHLTVRDLRPNLDLKKACEEFLDQNGWAADW
ncbi:hypothetical protein BJ878DRAFT_429126 [Calycina marina]|uniref:U-box domain-containing protein n=1 Tax=Calycina marina TaxID=1763456 RepID=A0A9P7YXL2_9HELO|nr:hypothetical protein BJ878DRAFT_429126 [Calycina marina]